MIGKIIELFIDIDELDGYFDEAGVDIMSLVSKPAIGVSWQAFEDAQDNPDTDRYVLSDEEQLSVLEFASSDDVGEVIDWQNTVFIDTAKTEFVNIGDYLKGIVGLDILGRRGVTQEPEIKFKYAGPSAERNFCKAMMRLQKIYTEDEIKSMGSRGMNRMPSHGDSSNAIWKWQGGPNCKHYWQKLEVFKEGRETVMLAKGKASGSAGRPNSTTVNKGYYKNSMQFNMDEDQMIITGPAMIPNVLIPRKDEDGNIFHVYFSKETIKAIAQKLFSKNMQNNTDINHSLDISNDNTLLESWIVEDPLMDKAVSLGFEDIVEGEWFLSYKINDEDTWNRIKSGDLTGFSVAGNFLSKIINE